MEQPTNVVGSKQLDENLHYKPQVLHIGIMPGLEPQPYEKFLEQGLDAVVIQAFCTGGVPSEGEYSFIPFIQKATDSKIPVYLLRGTTVAVVRSSGETKERNLEKSIYEPEMDAIKAGAIPLERPDISQVWEVTEAIIEVYRTKPTYDEGIEAVSKIFSRPEFLAKIKEMRK